MLRLHKTQFKTDTTAARGQETYTCTNKNPDLGIFQTGKQTNCKTCLEIFMIFLLFISFNFHILYSEKICQNCMFKNVWKKYAKIVCLNTSEYMFSVLGKTTLVQPALPSRSDITPHNQHRMH